MDITTNKKSIESVPELVEGKDGYKKTKVGWIPEEWNVKKLGSIGTFSKGKGVSKSEILSDGLPAIRYGEIYTKHNDFIKTFNSFINDASAKASNKLEQGDLLFAGSGESLEDIGKCVAFPYDYEAYAGGDIIIMRNHNQNATFMGYLMNHEVFRRQTYRFGQGHSVVHIYANSLKGVRIPLPLLPEQQKIAEILSTWDKAIEQSQNLIQQLKSRKKGLFDNLLLGKIRVNQKSKSFKKTKLGVDLPSDWDVKTVSDIFHERKEVSKDIQEFPLYSLTIKNGLTEKTAQYERSFLLKDKENNKYRLVYNDDILYNPMNLRFGAIAKANISNPVSVSAYYNVMHPIDSDVNVNYFINLFKTHRYMHIYDRIAIGSLEEKKRVHLSMFLNIEVPFPPLEEQIAITKILTTADNEIKTQESYLVQLQAQKKGLMQQLLTGQKRVF